MTALNICHSIGLGVVKRMYTDGVCAKKYMWIEGGEGPNFQDLCILSARFLPFRNNGIHTKTMTKLPVSSFKCVLIVTEETVF